MKTRTTLTFLILAFLPLLAMSQTTWNKVDAIPAEDVIDFVIKGDTIWAAAGATVYISYDEGNSWGYTGAIDEHVEEIYTLHVDNDTDTIVYAGALGPGIFVSKTGGLLWEPMNEGLTGWATRVIDIAERNDTLFIGTDGAGVYFRPKNAAQWQPYNDGLGNLIAYTCNALLTTKDRLYLGAGASGYLYHRAGNEVTWNSVQIDQQLFDLTALNFVETNGAVLAATTRGIYRSIDQGKTWRPFGSGFNPIEFGAARYQLNKTGNDLFLTISVPNFNAYLFHSSDGGANWYFIDDLLEAYGYGAGRTSSRIFLATQYGLWYRNADIISDDNEIPVNRPIADITVDAVYPNPVENQLNVKFTLQQRTNVTAAILDVLGRQVASLYNDELPAGEHTFTWQTPQIPAGTYQLVCKTPQGIVAKSIVKTK